MRHDAHFVEQLATRGGEAIGRMISVECIEPNPNQPRTDVGDLGELEASIREKGILEPLLVKPISFGRFMIISGERRFRAASLVGLREVPCIELDVDDATVAEIALIENLQRKDLTAFEEADGLKALVERFGYTHQEIAEKIGKSRSSVTETLLVASLTNEIRDLCRRADINSKSLLLQIVRQPDSVSMRSLIDRIQLGGIGRDDLRKERRFEKKSPKRKPTIFNFKGLDFTLEVKFTKDKLTKSDIVKCLETVILNLKTEIGIKM
jgi:ParB family chromosome partitioning protein